MKLFEIVSEAKEEQTFSRDSDHSTIISFRNGVLLDQTMNPPIFRREDFEVDDWYFIETLEN